SWIHGPGAGLFTGKGNEMWAWDAVKAEWDQIGIKITPDMPAEWQSFVREGRGFIQFQRDGWKPVTPWEVCDKEETAGIAKWRYGTGVRRIAFHKPVPGIHRWKLQLTHWLGDHGDENRGPSFDTFALVSPEGNVKRCEGWCSADYDDVKGRIVWTQDNVLYGAKVGSEGLMAGSVLYDATEVRYEASAAPY
ncbi:MAG: hypothetical protein JWO89_268, partial [Verrucomicrobiaceae bacterium]|nr:hypothetical protein [Verrucomicrobiaceae bacterium]